MKSSIDELRRIAREEPERIQVASDAPTICSDGDTSMFAEVVNEMGIVSIGLLDGGGFSSMYMNRQQWAEVRQSLDALFDQLES